MTFQRLNIRAKKSLPGLYSFDNMDRCHTSKSTTVHQESPSHSDILLNSDDDLEEFGARLERCKASPSKNSTSKRQKLFGSLRSLRSLANLHSSPTKITQSRIEHTESPVKHMGSCTTFSPIPPSLALLNFEQSPSDKPMFELNLHERSVSGASLEVQHSSPITVPGSGRKTTLYSVVGHSASDLPSGTIPDTPGPMQRAFIRDIANEVTWQHANLTPLESHIPSTPVLTPLPGTNLSVGDVDPELIPLPPSVNASMVQISPEVPGYFDLPVHEQLNMNKADMLNGLAYLKLADEYNRDANKENDGSDTTRTNSCPGPHSPPMKTRHEPESVELNDTTNALGTAQDQTWALRCKQQANDSDAVNDLDLSQHHHSLPFRLKQNEEGVYEQNKKQVVINEGSETRSDRRTVDKISEQTHECPNQPKFTGNPADSATSGFPPDTIGGCKSPVNFAYIVLENPKEHRLSIAQENTWGEHTGLYDGSGYGKESSGPATPGEPDEGTKDVHRQPSPRFKEGPSATLSIHRASSGEEIPIPTVKDENIYAERAREWSPLTTDEQYDYESLEFIYRAYT
ncbi:hypothetical protein OPT61_g5497 [Boeremia exigua]|uniref:Uncharacterized protein n=1 Tax=Boeremia exigua TaxID=749465 RepID=A0ACC2IA94_9PLEO|nr:hypothetical protein OPT61_g5497 [Boeremia exigua]